jgi:hypothetical protein
MVLAGSIHVALQIRPFVKRSLKTRYAAGDWLKIAIPWWILVGVRGAQMLVARLTTDT